MIRATGRAFPCPFAARLDRRAVRAGRLRVDGQRRRRDHAGDPRPVAFGGTDLEIGARRPGDLLGDELAERLAAIRRTSSPARCPQLSAW
jgi:hypothetical protein